METNPSGKAPRYVAEPPPPASVMTTPKVETLYVAEPTPPPSMSLLPGPAEMARPPISVAEPSAFTGIRVPMQWYCNNPPAGRRYLLEEQYPAADPRVIDRIQFELDDVCNKREWYQRRGLTPPAGQADAPAGSNAMTYVIAAGVGLGAGYLVGRWLRSKKKRR